MVLTIINGIMLLIMIIVAVVMYNMIQSLGELIVRFVELNQEHFKNQKHLITKSGDLASSLKKAPQIMSNFKAMSRKLDGSIVKLDQNISRLEN